MSVEQSIYTCCATRKDTGTAGFGYFYITPEMEQMCKASAELSAITNSYSAPKNQELWWDYEETAEIREANEKRNIKIHHPISFRYSIINIDGNEKAVLSYGINLGRDVPDGVRPGNIMVNTLITDKSDLNNYPFMYYGSNELFVDYDRTFFINNDVGFVESNKPKNILEGKELSIEKVLDFIRADSVRIAYLLNMLQFILNGQGEGFLEKQILICDRKEEIIYWIAALSVIFPLELAKKISFNTYSYLGSVESANVVYDNVMLCGVYSPSINDDPQDENTTNYRFGNESVRENGILFDFEKQFYTDSEEKYSYFNVFLENSLLNNYSLLEDYHNFIIEKTTCRDIDEDYAKGYAYYVIDNYKTEDSLGYLQNAIDFALKYMDDDAIKKIMLMAYSCTIDAGRAGMFFDDVVELSDKCLQSQKISGTIVFDKYASFITSLLRTDDYSRDEYFDYKEKVKVFFENHNRNIDVEIIKNVSKLWTKDDVDKISKKWILLEMLELICKYYNSFNITVFDTNVDNMGILFKELISRVFSNEDNRKNLIEAYSDIFNTDEQKICFAENVHNTADVADKDLIAYLSDRYINAADLSKDKILKFVSSNNSDANKLKDLFVTELENKVLSKYGYIEAEKMLRVILSNEEYNGYAKRIVGILKKYVKIEKSEKSLEYYYSIVKLEREFRLIEPDRINLICKEYKTLLLNFYPWYDLDKNYGENWLRLLNNGIANYILDDNEKNIILMYVIKYYAKCFDNVRIPMRFDEFNGLNVSIIEPDVIGRCVDIIAESFYNRASAANNVFAVERALFFDLNDYKSAKMFISVISEWIVKVLNDSKEARTQNAAFILAMSCIDYDVDYYEIGVQLYEKKIKIDDLEEKLKGSKVSAYLKKTGVSEPEKKIINIIDQIEKAYDELKQNTIFGKLKSTSEKFFSKFGGNGKVKK